MFFDRFQAMCRENQVSVYRACTDVGLNRSAVSKWKNGSCPNAASAAKLADYFGVSTDYLLEKTELRKPAAPGKDEIKFALFGGDADITDEMYEEVKRFAAFVKQREAEKKKE